MRKVGCADAVPITQKPVFRRSGEPYAVRSGTYWFGEEGTGDPVTGDRPLLYPVYLETKAKGHYSGTSLRERCAEPASKVQPIQRWCEVSLQGEGCLLQHGNGQLVVGDQTLDGARVAKVTMRPSGSFGHTRRMMSGEEPPLAHPTKRILLSYPGTPLFRRLLQSATSLSRQTAKQRAPQIHGWLLVCGPRERSGLSFVLSSLEPVVP
jgi:hypothetical protein